MWLEKTEIDFYFQDSDIQASSQKRAKLNDTEEFNFETTLGEGDIPSPDNLDISTLEDLSVMVDNIQNHQEFHSSHKDPSYKTLKPVGETSMNLRRDTVIHYAPRAVSTAVTSMVSTIYQIAFNFIAQINRHFTRLCFVYPSME
jgi:hypothetical protein